MLRGQEAEELLGPVRHEEEGRNDPQDAQDARRPPGRKRLEVNHKHLFLLDMGPVVALCADF